MISGLELLAVLACFLVGAIPFAKVAMWGTGIDITKVGSKNPGFNNVLRVSSKSRAAVALVGDLSKGYVALLLFSGAAAPPLLWVMGLAAVIGHCWSPFLGGNGGKGVATAFGVLLKLEFFIALACLPLYPLLRAFGRRMGWRQEGAISSMTTTFILATVVFILRGSESGVFAYAMFVIVAVRHAANLREIFS